MLTDPTFDPPGGKYRFGWGTGSRKTAGPALSREDLGEIDAVLLSHDHHDDNLDPAGRALLPGLGVVITTTSGAKRLGGTARGLAPWESTTLEAPGNQPLQITATPCRHGPPGFGPIVGDVIGFFFDGVWVSGDTVLYDGVRAVADRLDVEVAIIHLGGVRFPITGPLRFTMTARDAVEVLDLIKPRVAIPIHYEGWAHFREGREQIERVTDRFRWLRIGEPVEI